ncbi:MAG: Response regulator [Labilithrix sp.]|nr:Response regulator [Labilithrix sp.]
MPGSRVLLVDHDVDALAQLAAKLRERGVRVSLANGSQMACERARSGGYDVVLAARAVAEPEDGAMGVIDALSVELPQVPPLLVLHENDDADDVVNGDSRVRRDDIDRIVLRIEQLSTASSGSRAARASLAPSAHTLENAPLADLLVVLSTERRSGTLTVTTPKGSGEVRLVEGDIADAVYVRLEGKKAITRMLGERDGTATFAPGAPAIMRRIHETTRTLVTEARALVDRAAAVRAQAGELTTSTLLAVDGGGVDSLSEVDQHVLSRLRVPAMVDDLLDELPHADVAILESIVRLDARGRVKRLGHASLRVQLCGPDQLHLLRASAARAKAAGFAGPARLVFAATPSKLAVFGHTVLSLADAFAPPEPTPSVPVPYVLATIRLGDGVELDVVALPLVPVYAPLWPMALAGAAILVRLDEAAAQSLEEACSSVAVPILDARAIFGALEESSAVQVASLIKTALDAEGAGLA